MKKYSSSRLFPAAPHTTAAHTAEALKHRRVPPPSVASLGCPYTASPSPPPALSRQKALRRRLAVGLCRKGTALGAQGSAPGFSRTQRLGVCEETRASEDIVDSVAARGCAGLAKAAREPRSFASRTAEKANSLETSNGTAGATLLADDAPTWRVSRGVDNLALCICHI